MTVEVTVTFTFKVRVAFTNVVVVLSSNVAVAELLLDRDVEFELIRIMEEVDSGSRTPRFDVYMVPSDDQVEVRNDRPCAVVTAAFMYELLPPIIAYGT